MNTIKDPKELFFWCDGDPGFYYFHKKNFCPGFDEDAKDDGVTKTECLACGAKVHPYLWTMIKFAKFQGIKINDM